MIGIIAWVLIGINGLLIAWNARTTVQLHRQVREWDRLHDSLLAEQIKFEDIVRKWNEDHGGAVISMN